MAKQLQGGFMGAARKWAKGSKVGAIVEGQVTVGEMVRVVEKGRGRWKGTAATLQILQATPSTEWPGWVELEGTLV